MSIGSKVKDLIQKNRYSQAELARYMEIDRSYLHRLINDKARWHQDQISAAAKFFNIPAGDLLNNKDSKINEPKLIYEAEVFRLAQESLEKLQSTIPLKILPERRTCIIQKLFEHWIVYKEIPTEDLAKKYFFYC